MNNKGFTLVELLTSIIIIGLIMVISIPAYISIHNSMQNTNYSNKLKVIKEEALKYGETMKDEIQDLSCIDVKISDLIKKGYINSDYRTKEALENPITKNEFSDNLSVCYCTSNNELKAFYIEPFDYTLAYSKGTEIRYNGKVYVSMTDYSYSEIVKDIDSNKSTDYKWDTSGNVTGTCLGYLNKEIELCISNKSLLNESYVISNFFKLIEC